MFKFFFLFLLFVNTANSTVADKEVFRTTLNYLIDSQNFSEAKKLTQDILKRYPADPEVIRLDGMTSLLSGDNEKASKSFRKAADLSKDEERALNLYLLAQSQLKENDKDSAREILKEMESLRGTKIYAREALADLGRTGTIQEYTASRYTDPSSGTTNQSQRLGLSFSTIFGYDTNPVFVPDYSQTRNDAESYFFSLNASGILDFAPSFGTFSNFLSFGMTKYTEELAKGFDNIRLSVATTFQPKSNFFQKNNLTFTNRFDQSFRIDDSPEYYFTSDSFGLRKDLKSLNGHHFAIIGNIGYRTYANKELVDSEDDRSGFSYGGRVLHRYEKAITWVNSLAFLDQKTKGRKFDTQSLDLLTNIQFPLPSSFLGTLSGGVSRVNYKLFPENRVDWMSLYGAEISRSIQVVQGLTGRLNYSRINNKSDVRESTYHQDTISLWINYEI